MLKSITQENRKMIGKSIAIIGAGQAGLQLGIGLLYSKLINNVSLFTNRNADQILRGEIMSSQGMFGSALRIEKNLKINFWDTSCPINKSVTVTVADKAKKIINFQGHTWATYQSVDQRLKYPKLMEEFNKLGGHIHIKDVGISELNTMAKAFDLIIVAGGRGEISRAFLRNNTHSLFDKHQRALACLYVQGITPVYDSPGVRVNILPGIGEYFIIPGLTLSGPCEMMLFEGIPGGPFDCWDVIGHPEQRLEKAISLLKEYIPWEAERCKSAHLTDIHGTLVGHLTPIVRHPTFRLPCGRPVLGLGDTVVLNDPVAGQGANNAAKAADIYLRRIIEHCDTLFDESWMHETFELYWEQHGKWSTQWSNMLLAPPKPHIIKLLEAASDSPELADIMANGFDDPSTLFPWIERSEDTAKIICKNLKNEKAMM
jgi:hypothetical protein